MSLSPKVVRGVRPDGQKGLFAAQPVEAGEVLLTYDGPILDQPTRLSIQIDDGKHIEGTEDSNAFVNHGCDASAFVDWDVPCLRARRALSAGDEITCNYFTTDYELHSPFVCSCGSRACKGEIRGFKYLSREERRALEPWLPPFLKRVLESD